MDQPTFDADGYPTEETHEAISNWAFGDTEGFLNFVGRSWQHGYGRIWMDGNLLKFATGGWSGNEGIIAAMRPSFFRILYWESSHRGGLEVFKIPDDMVGWVSGTVGRMAA